MVVEYIRYTIPPDQADAFKAAYDRARTSLDASEYCLCYELARGVEEPEHWILRIEWESVEQHEQGFRRSDEFRPFLEAIRPYIGQIEEMKHYEATAVSSHP